MKTFCHSTLAILLVSFLLAGCAAGTTREPAVAEACAPTAPAVTSAGFGNDAPGASTGAVSLPPDQDPALTDGDKYHVLLDNSQVRVLRYSDNPGGKTNQHHHPEFVLYALSPFRRKLTFPDGTSKEREFAAGDVIWMPEQTHIGENTGDTDTEVVIIEVKRP